MPADQRHYARRILARAWAEARIKWDIYKWATAIAGALVPLGVIVYHNGLGSLMNLGDTALNAVGGGAAGGAVGFAVTWVISFFRSFKLLDDDHVAEIATGNLALHGSEGREQTLIAENSELKKPKRDRHQQIKHNQARSEVDKLGPDGLIFLRALIGRGELQFETFHLDLIRNHGMSEDGFTAALAAFRAAGQTHLVDFVPPTPYKPNSYIRINEIYRDVLLELLHPEEN